MTAALEGGEWSAARPGRTLPLGKTQYPLYRRVGGPQGRSGRAEILVPIGIRSRTVQPVVSRYTDWATGPTQMSVYNIMNYISITRCVIFLMPAMYEGGRCRQNTTVFVSLLLGWRNVSATVGHLRVTKMYNEEKLYSVISLVAVHIVNLQRDLDAMRFIRIELNMFDSFVIRLLSSLLTSQILKYNRRFAAMREVFPFRRFSKIIKKNWYTKY